ncbi:MAG: polysaccharide deacetylase family protein [Chloroflexota bacterium]|nr:polysaccharide deacetylase family protein [Chloroflexota bacterium]
MSRQSGLKNSLILFTLLVAALLAACSGASAQPAATPSAAMTIVPVIATPDTTPTFAPTAIPAATRAPTAFVTAPAPGSAAIVPILMYHHIQDLADGASELRLTWTVSPENFDAQMAWIAQRGFHAISMAQLAAHLKHSQPLPAKPIVVSFDDGWEEQYTVAFPILKKYDLSGTFFVYTNPIDHKEFMTWAQLQEMSTAGMDIQAHTLSHPHLRALAPDAAMKEIADSKTILETRLGKPIVAFAYPFGEYNAAIIGMVKQSGIELAVTLAAGYRQRPDELFTLHRIRVSYNDALQDFSSRLPQ